MKAFLKHFTVTVIIFLLANTNLFSQVVTVNGSISQDYPDLTSAFDAINLGTHGNGNIQVLINQSHTLTTSAILNGGRFASCEIKPTTTVTINGSLILDGADNVTIDGRIGFANGVKLNFSNSIELKNGASDNVVKFVSCNIFHISPSLSNNNSIEDSDMVGISFSGSTGLRIIRNTCEYMNLTAGTKDVDIINNKVTLWTYVYSIGTINIKGNHLGLTTVIPNYAGYGYNIVNYDITNNFFCKYLNFTCTCNIDCEIDEIAFLFGSDHNPDLTANICNNTMVYDATITDLCGNYFNVFVVASYIGADVGNITFKNNIAETHLNGLVLPNYYSIYPAVNYDADYNCYSNLYAFNPSDNFHHFNKKDIINSIKKNRNSLSPLNNEQHSVFKNVSFQDVTTGDLHLAGSSIGDNDLKGIPIPGITTDIDNEIRRSPYMGADEADFPLPVELSSFTSSVNNNNVLLNWTTVSEINNSGFDLERLASGSGSILNGEWLIVNFVKGHGNSNTPNNYSFEDKNLSSGKYKYRLKQIDFNGNFEYFNLSNEVEIGVPHKFSLSQNYPNPFNPTTKVNYELPASQGEQIMNYVSLKVYDISGKEVMSLVNENQSAGRYEVTFDGSNLSSGVYFYKLVVSSSREAGSSNLLEAGNNSQIRKMVLMK